MAVRRSSGVDLIVTADACHTMTDGGRGAQGVAIRGGTIVAMGTRRGLSRLRGRGTRVIDLSGGAITPGLVDSHTHFFYWALSRALVIDVSAAASRADALELLRRGARRRRVGAWVCGRGFDQNRWGGGFPSAADLDAVLADVPAMIRSRDGHSAWLNSAGMRRAGVAAGTPDPKGGRYLRDAHGRPTGIAQETAVDLLPNPLAELAAARDARSLGVIDRALEAAYAEAWRHGIVGVHSMDDAASLWHLKRQRAAGALGVRAVHAIPLANLGHARALGLRSGVGDDWLRIGGVKIFSDGALGSQTAYMFEPYPERGDCGVANIAGAELREAVAGAARDGWVSWVHAIGDRAVSETVAALAAAQPLPRAARRRARGATRGADDSARGADDSAWMPPRVEHAQCARAADVRRMARAGIVASMQPCHILGDIATADRHWPVARRDAYPFRRMLRAGVTLAMGSDVPIESIDPRRSLFGGVARTDEAGEPKGGWFPKERLSVMEVLEGFTAGAARSVGAWPRFGVISPGAAADLTLWERDPASVATEELLTVGIAGCVIDGEVRL
ncbi:MAG: N-substituted formamide deformylase [Phycisphaerae bacterium]|nr:N-substituted formamide deformylase [Phycisphaerae bacterium]